MKIVPCSTWTMERQRSTRVEMVGINDKRHITAVFCGSLTGKKKSYCLSLMSTTFVKELVVKQLLLLF